MNGWWVGLTLLGLGMLVVGWFVLGLCHGAAATTAMDAKAVDYARFAHAVSGSELTDLLVTAGRIAEADLYLVEVDRGH